MVSQKKDGGAIYNQYGNLTISKSTLADNRASRDCGAIYNDEGKLTIKEYTIRKNRMAKK